jgi:hypothetical protein
VHASEVPFAPVKDSPNRPRVPWDLPAHAQDVRAVRVLEVHREVVVDVAEAFGGP